MVDGTGSQHSKTQHVKNEKVDKNAELFGHKVYQKQKLEFEIILP